VLRTSELLASYYAGPTANASHVTALKTDDRDAGASVWPPPRSVRITNMIPRSTASEFFSSKSLLSCLSCSQFQFAISGAERLVDPAFTIVAAAGSSSNPVLDAGIARYTNTLRAAARSGGGGDGGGAQKHTWAAASKPQRAAALRRLHVRAPSSPACC